MAKSHFVDTHFHLDLFKNCKEIAESIELQGIYTIAVTNSPTVFDYTYKISKSKKFIRPAIGLHPELVNSRYKEVDLLEKKISMTKYIGEVGLDYKSVSYSDKKKQKKVFEKILEVCSNGPKKIFTIHSRGAEKDVIDMIGKDYPNAMILHWYSGGFRVLEEAKKSEFYFSFNWQMLNSEKGKKVLMRVPKDKILTESDGPFVNLKGKNATPEIISETVKIISKVIELNFEDTKDLIYKNFERLLKN